jgi:hypothetical protein
MRVPVVDVSSGSGIEFRIVSPLGTLEFRGSLHGDVLEGELRGALSGKLHLVRYDALRRELYHKYVGTYRLSNGRTALITYRSFGQLFAVVTEGPDVAPIVRRTLTLVPRDSTTFFTSGSVNAAPKRDEWIRFISDGSGRAQRLEWIVPDGKPVTGNRGEDIRQESVEIEHEDVVLNGTLWLPRGPGPHAAVASVGGSGPTTRDQVILRAREFARAGVAVLVWDKRGTGHPSGDWRKATFADLAADAVAAFRFLQGRPDIDRGRIGYHGHSQGGWVVPLALQRTPQARFAIITSGSAMGPAEQETYRAEAQVKRSGNPDTDAVLAARLMMLKWDYAATGRGWNEYRAALVAASGRPRLSVVNPPPDQGSDLWTDLRAQLAVDPIPALSRVRVPLLLLFGAEDDEVPPGRSAERWRQIMRETGNADVTVAGFAGVGHSIFFAQRSSHTVLIAEPREKIARWLAQHGILR